MTLDTLFTNYATKMFNISYNDCTVEQLLQIINTYDKDVYYERLSNSYDEDCYEEDEEDDDAYHDYDEDDLDFEDIDAQIEELYDKCHKRYKMTDIPPMAWYNQDELDAFKVIWQRRVSV